MLFVFEDGMSKTFPILINARLAGIGKRYWSISEKMSERAVHIRQIGGNK